MEQSEIIEEMAGLGQKVEIICWLKSISDPIQFEADFITSNNLHVQDMCDLLLDDMALDDPDPDRLRFMHIGPIEEEALRALALKVQSLFKNVGYGRPNSDYIGHPLWDEVTRAARASFLAITAPR